VVVWVISPVFFQVTVPPTLRQAEAGLNLRSFPASTVTEVVAVAVVHPPEVPDPLLAEAGSEPDPPGIGPVPQAASKRAIPPTAIPMRVEYRRWWDRSWVIGSS
jgi:hypothetical protein